MRGGGIVKRSVIVAVSVTSMALGAASAFAEDVRVDERGFDPVTLHVEAGETIVWRNDTRATQTIIGQDGRWDSGPLRPQETFSLTLRQAGDYRYGTADGRWLGTIHVSEAESAAPEEPEEPEEAEAAHLPETGVSAAALALAGLAMLGLGLVAVAVAAPKRAARAPGPDGAVAVRAPER